MNFLEFELEPHSKALPSLEEMKDKYKHKLDEIINKGCLTVENIETFADDALEELTKMTSEILAQYGANEAFEPANLQLSVREQEDDAFKKLGLTDIQQILERVIEVKAEVDSLKAYIGDFTEDRKEVITPPTQSLSPGVKPGSGNGIAEKSFIPRILTILYLLEEDLGVEKEAVKLIKGKVTQEMMRQTPYVRVEIPDFQRVVYICEEEGNASFVFDTEKLRDIGISFDNLDVEDKGNKNDLIAKYPGIGIRIVQSKNWRERIRDFIESDIPEVLDNGDLGLPTESPISFEFKRKEKKDFFSFDDFQSEVRAVYQGQSNIVKWYRGEFFKHEKWPSCPRSTYKNKGWVGYLELVGKAGREHRQREEFLSFADFQKEVRNAYSGRRDVVNWYSEEYPKHDNWPSQPAYFYKDIGWQGFPELIGLDKKPQWSRKTLSFEDFKREVRALYPAGQDVVKWFRKEKNNHPNWHSNPEQFYKDKGWEGYAELVEKYPPFDEFQAEVRVAYQGQGNVKKWYDEERKKHPKWHSNPHVYYKDNGWEGFSKLVGRNGKSAK